MGAPGSGKGTQAELLCSKMNLRHISTGNMLRSSIQERTPLGLKAKGFMDEGGLVPDDLIISLMEETLNKCRGQGFVLDGFPRTLSQAKALDRLLGELHLSLDFILLFVLDEKEIIRRITGRRVAPVSKKVYHLEFSPPKNENFCDLTGERLVQREDDRIEAVKRRLKIYEEQEKILSDYFGQRITKLQAQGSPMDIHQQLLKTLSP